MLDALGKMIFGLIEKFLMEAVGNLVNEHKAIADIKQKHEELAEAVLELQKKVFCKEGFGVSGTSVGEVATYPSGEALLTSNPPKKASFFCETVKLSPMDVFFVKNSIDTLPEICHAGVAVTDGIESAQEEPKVEGAENEQV